MRTGLRWCFPVLFLCLAFGVIAVAADKKRNPFDVEDVSDPDSKDVQDYAAKVKLAGDKKDANAEQWVKDKTRGKKGSLDGEWSDRWNYQAEGEWNHGREKAKIKEVDKRVYILAVSSSGTYLIDLKREKNRLIGKYQNLKDRTDAGPCVFEVVDDERIDGAWGNGRWDFRRKLE